MNYKVNNDNIEFTCPECFNVELSLFCGQAFRWKKDEKGSFYGTVKGKTVVISADENKIILSGTNEKDFLEIWVPYFDLDRDYKALTDNFRSDKYISQALDEFYGIRILHQEPWEALCSFIISQNNNIPRICGIIDRLCAFFGEKNSCGEYSFPSAKAVSQLTLEQMAPLRAGFRSKYILDAAQKIENGEISLEEIANMPIEKAREELMKIKGVGPKVAECTLLYGFGRLEAFPVDVWVKRIMAELYEEGLPSCTRNFEGVAQQYLFHWRRNRKEEDMND